MKNKKAFLKLGVFGLVVWWLGLSFTSAATLFHLNINNQKVMSDTALSRNIMQVHFADNWNNFGWFLYFSNGLWDDAWEEGDDGACSTTDCYVKISNDTDYKCNRQMKWFYYNAERWERLWPLDDETLNNWGLSGSLTRNGGLFTRCAMLGYEAELEKCKIKATDDGEDYDECKDVAREKFKVDEYGYYGYLEHEYKWQEMALVSWVEYEYNSSTKFVSVKSDSKLVPTFIRLKNLYPVWFMYDYNWGVGIVWCKLTWGKTVKDVLWEIKNADWSIDLKNIFAESNGKLTYTKWAWMDCADTVWDPLIGIVIEWMVGMGERSEFEVVWNQKDEKMQYFSSADINNTTLINYAKKKSEILCRWKWNKPSSDNVVCYDGKNVTVQKGKTVVVKNWNGTISPETSATPDSYDVFINNWNLIINETNDKFVFTKDGFINTSSDATSFNSAVGSNPDNYNWNDVAVWSYIKWNFIVNWKVKGSGEWGKLKNKYFIHWKFTTMDDFTTLLDTFAWRCVNWVSTKESDDAQSYCPPTNNYAVASLVVIDQNYDSPFFVN